MKAYHLIRLLLPCCMCVFALYLCVHARKTVRLCYSRPSFSLFVSLSVYVRAWFCVGWLQSISLELPGCRVCIRAYVLITSFVCLWYVESEHDSFRYHQLLSLSGSLCLARAVWQCVCV